MSVAVLANQKGGVGKTSTTANFAGELAINRKKKVLLVDTDPSRALTVCVGFREPDGSYHTLYNLYSDDPRDNNITIHDCIYPTMYDNLHIIPSGEAVAWVEKVASTQSSGDHILKELLFQVKDEYDYIVIDTPPLLTKTLDSALIAADFVLIPVQAEFLAAIGSAQLLKNINIIRKRTNPNLKIAGAFANMFDTRLNMSHETLNTINHHYEDAACSNVIRVRADIKKASEEGRLVQDLFPKGESTQDFRDLVNEIFAKIKVS
jgi:chromosome partitioning protein